MSLARITPIVGSLYALLRNRLGLNVATPLGAQELSCTVAPDRRLVVLGHEPIAGFERAHGTVADEAAMLALHTLDSTTLSISPTFVTPGDSVLRTDDPGWRWHCISGHGTTPADWERRPLAGALAGLSTEIAGAQPLDADLTAIATQGLSTWGLAWLALSGYTAAKNALSITRADIGDATAIGRALMAVATPNSPKIPQLNADGTVTPIDVPSGAGGSFAGARVVLNASQSISNGTRQPVQWVSADYDTAGYWSSGSPTRLTIPSGLGGRYLIGAAILWAAQGGGYLRQFELARNGATPYLLTEGKTPAGGGYFVGSAASVQVELAAGDYVEVIAYQDCGGILDIIHHTTYGHVNAFWLQRVG